MKMILMFLLFSLFLFITPGSCYLRDGGRSLTETATNRAIKLLGQHTLANWREIQLEVEEGHRRLTSVNNPTNAEKLTAKMYQITQEGMSALINIMAYVDTMEPYQVDGDEPNEDLMNVLEKSKMNIKKYQMTLMTYMPKTKELGITSTKQIDADTNALLKTLIYDLVQLTEAQTVVSAGKDNMNSLLSLRHSAESTFVQSLQILIDLSPSNETLRRLSKTPLPDTPSDFKFYTFEEKQKWYLANGYGKDEDECFSPEASVEVLDKGKVAMKDLVVGDKVLTGDETYEAVYMFGHLNRNNKAEFLQIFTDDKQHPLEATCNHLVHVMAHGSKKARLSTFCELEVGDILHGSKNEPKIITQIGNVFRDGFYAPLTPSGTIVVDGIVASIYSSILEDDVYEGVGSINTLFLSEEQLIHISLAPLRLLCIGVSPIFINYHTEDGIAWFVKLGVYLSTFYSHSVLVHAILLSLVAIVCFPIYAFELVFGSAQSPLAILVCAVAGLIAQHHASRLGSLGGIKKVKVI